MTTTLTRRLVVAVSALALGSGLTLTACGSDDNDSASGNTSASAEASYPRTVTVDDGSVELTAKPEHIAVLSSDLASLVLPLTGGDHVALAPKMSASGDLKTELDKVGSTMAPSASIDAEQVMASKPDLVMISARHDFEKDAAEQLRSFDVPVAVFGGDTWSGSEGIIDHISEVADLVGEQDKGKELTDDLSSRRDEIIARADGKDKPKTIGIWAHANQQMIGSKTLMLTGLIREAGGDPAVDHLDAQSMITADPEFIVKEAPEVIVVQTSADSGKDAFSELIDNPAMKDVPAVRDGRVYYVDSATTGVSSGTAIIDGLDEVSKAIFNE
jgi:iron complex transport system substrate-binding protein